MPGQRMRNLSGQSHSEWQVRGVAGLAGHLAVGGTAQWFDFRRRGERSHFTFVFIGYGLGAGPQLGAGSAGFPMPHEFIWETGGVVGRSLWEAGRRMLGGDPERVPPPAYGESMGAFSDIESASFSAVDLHRAMGRLTSASASLAMGYAITYITAFTTSQVLFESQSTAGDDNISGTAGVSLGANVNAGMWFRCS